MAKNKWDDVAAAFAGVKIAVFAGMAYIAYKAYKANGNSLTNPADGTQVTVDSGSAIGAGIEYLAGNASPQVKQALKKGGKVALDRYLHGYAIKTGRVDK